MTVQPLTQTWKGSASTRLLPPLTYWEHLRSTYPDEPVADVQELSDLGQNELRVSALPPGTTNRLLEALADDGWLRRERQFLCPNDLCDHEPTDEDIAAGICPHCGEQIAPATVQQVIYVRDLPPKRPVDWVVVIHGMNTKGAWQEEFSWFLSTTWGHSIPVAIYKYGIIIAGVIMAWRRRALQRRLRAKIAELRRQARVQGYGEKPDVVAHSFGTWLLGHLLEDELEPDVDDPLRFGRVILAGCILRPNYDWAAVIEAGLVEQVLNHYATKDPIVPLAHWTIRDSGPSGRRGFDEGVPVINVEAEGLNHSDLFSVDRCIIDGALRQKCPADGARGQRHLDHTYGRYWQPFLTWPEDWLVDLPNKTSQTPWRSAPAPLRGTLFPFVGLPLVGALALLLLGAIGGTLNRWLTTLAWISAAAGGLLALLLIGNAVTLLISRIRAARDKKRIRHDDPG